jgi:hypothetical protein
VISRAPERRAAAVAELCGTDAELCREIESLLESQHGASLLDLDGLLALNEHEACYVTRDGSKIVGHVAVGD